MITSIWCSPVTILGEAFGERAGKVFKNLVSEIEVPLDDFGYHFYPREGKHTVSYFRLDVTLMPEPTQRFFDPEIFRLNVASDFKGTDFLEVQHPWAGADYYRACIGHVLLRNRKDETINAFTYGGDLKIKADNETTTGRLLSQVPIFRLDGPGATATLLAQETDILIAKKRANCMDRSLIEDQLAITEPQALYYSCLQDLEQKFKDFQHPKFEYIQRFLVFIQMEIDRIQASQDPLTLFPTLDELLS